MKEIENNTIGFFERKLYMLSNFSAFAILWKGKFCLTAEHAYQSEKFDDESIKESIRKSMSPYDCKKIARQNINQYRSDWDDVKLRIMKEILREKVEQHPYVREKLIESGNSELVEDSPYDDFWGTGNNNNGQNNLGKIWMEIRREVASK